MTIRNDLARFLRDDDGAAGVEYGILVAAIAAGIVVSAFAIGGAVSNAFSFTEDAIITGCAPSGACGGGAGT
jgi:Flp pilus assembly pilin Flp